MPFKNAMPDEADFRHVGGGQKGMFLALRYVFIVCAAYLLVGRSLGDVVDFASALAIAAALGSNVGLSFVPARALFTWWVQAPVLVADTLWVSWMLRSTHAVDGEFFLLYFFVLVLTTIGEDVLLVALGAAVVSMVSVYASRGGSVQTSTPLLRVVFLFAVALFYGHVLTRLKGERQRSARTMRRARDLETKVAERTAELNQLCNELRAASTAKSEFMASMSHELRTPLHVIIGYADMLVDEGDGGPSDAGGLGGHIRRAGMDLLHLVDEVLELGRLDAGRVRVEPRPVPVADFVEGLRRREWIAPFPGVVLAWDTEPVSTDIETDPGKLQIVVANLISNAIKYTREGSVVVRVRDRADAAGVEFEVDDTGPGIPAAQLATIQEPFHDSAESRGMRGIGLGLALVYRYAAQLGAEVTLRSTVGRGTSFRVHVPYRFAVPGR